LNIEDLVELLCHKTELWNDHVQESLGLGVDCKDNIAPILNALSMMAPYEKHQM
jgi:hypothetical protein